MSVAHQRSLARDLHVANHPHRFFVARAEGLATREEAHQDIEGFGIVLLEAAASGKPVVAGRSGGVDEAVLDGKTGLLVDATDPEAVAEAVLTLLGDPIRAAEMGRLGRDRAVAEFSWELVTARIRAVGHAPW